MEFVGQFESFIGVNFWTALFVLLNTLAIFFVAKKFLVVPVLKIIADRQKEIDDLYAEGETARTEANNLRDEYTQKLAETKQEAAQLISQAQNTAQKRSDEIIAAARQESEAIKDKAFADIELEKKKARDELKGEISVIAMDIATKVVEREINAGDHTALIDGFIDGMGDA